MKDVEWDESIHLLFAKGKFYFQQFFFTLLWTLQKARRLVYSFFIRRKQAKSWVDIWVVGARRCLGWAGWMSWDHCCRVEAAMLEMVVMVVGVLSRVGWQQQALGMVNAKMGLYDSFAVLCPERERKGETYRGKIYIILMGGVRNGVVGWVFIIFGPPSEKLKNKDKMCLAEMKERSERKEIMKMAACNFLIASHFTIKFIRFFLRSTLACLLFSILEERGMKHFSRVDTSVAWHFEDKHLTERYFAKINRWNINFN